MSDTQSSVSTRLHIDISGRGKFFYHYIAQKMVCLSFGNNHFRLVAYEQVIREIIQMADAYQKNVLPPFFAKK